MNTILTPNTFMKKNSKSAAYESFIKESYKHNSGNLKISLHSWLGHQCFETYSDNSEFIFVAEIGEYIQIENKSLDVLCSAQLLHAYDSISINVDDVHNDKTKLASVKQDTIELLKQKYSESPKSGLINSIYNSTIRSSLPDELNNLFSESQFELSSLEKDNYLVHWNDLNLSNLEKSTNIILHTHIGFLSDYLKNAIVPEKLKEPLLSAQKSLSSISDDYHFNAYKELLSFSQTGVSLRVHNFFNEFGKTLNLNEFQIKRINEKFLGEEYSFHYVLDK